MRPLAFPSWMFDAGGVEEVGRVARPSTERGRIRPVARLLAFALAGVVLIGAGCNAGDRAEGASGGDASAGPGSSDAGSDANRPIDASDAGPRDATAPSVMSFLLSGSYRGTVSWRSDGGGAEERKAHAILSEQRDGSGEGTRVEGVLTVFASDGATPEFEYVLEGTVNRGRTALDLKLSARRCPFGVGDSCTDAMSPDQTPSEPMFRAEAVFENGRLALRNLERRPEFEAPPGREIDSRLERFGLEPLFDPNGDRLSPGDGVKPTGFDVEERADTAGESAPLPLGETTWKGRVTNAGPVGGRAGSPSQCDWTIEHGDEPKLQSFECGGRTLPVDGSPSTEPPRVLPSSFGWNDRDGVVRHIWFLVEGPKTLHLFVGTRIGGLYSGVVVRNPDVESSQNGGSRPTQPLQYEIRRMEGAFHWKYDK